MNDAITRAEDALEAVEKTLASPRGDAAAAQAVLDAYEARQAEREARAAARLPAPAPKPVKAAPVVEFVTMKTLRGVVSGLGAEVATIQKQQLADLRAEFELAAGKQVARLLNSKQSRDEFESRVLKRLNEYEEKIMQLQRELHELRMKS